MSAEVTCLGRTVVILLSLARHTESQATTPLPSINDSNASNCTYNENGSNESYHNATGLPWCPTTPPPPCITTCCDAEIKREAKNACMQFTKWGAEPARCVLWENEAERVCNSACSDCQTIGNAMLIQCVFTLQLQMTRASALSYCQQMVTSFVTFQCPSACVDQLSMCYTQEFRDCNARCGNWYQCDCYPRIGQEDPSDTCVGETVLLRQDRTPDTCHAYPNLCKAHFRTPCGIYKHCPVDLCIVTNKVCEVRDTCQSAGVCAPNDGKCYYQFLPDESPCDDGLFYTHTDRCQNSVCVGVEDKCVRYDVKCESTNPCLKPTDKVKGACDPPTGSCVFEAKPDGTSCPSQPGMAPKDYDGNCSAGLCRRQVLQPCAGNTCRARGFCMLPPECDALTGTCINNWKADGTTCDDAYGSPVGDICIEGRCIGRVVQDAKYAYAGQNLCEGQGSVETGTQRYFGDVRSQDACEQQCTKDPWCIAYAYGYYTCIIYGGERTRDPDPAYFTGATWTILDPGVDYTIEHGIICYLKQEQGVPFPEDSEAAAWFGATVTFLVVLPGSWGLCMIWGTMCKSYRALTGCRCCRVAPSDAYVEDVHMAGGKEALGAVVGEPLHLNAKMAYLENDGFESNEQVISGRGTGMIAADPNTLPDEVDLMKLAQANPSEEDTMTDPRGEVFASESNEVFAPDDMDLGSPPPPPPPT